MTEPKIECVSCGKEPTEILARSEYTIKYDEEQSKWVKDYGDITYVCGLCLEALDAHDIADILRQVDEL